MVTWPTASSEPWESYRTGGPNQCLGGRDLFNEVGLTGGKMADYPFPWEGLRNVQPIRFLGISLGPRWAYSTQKVSLLIETSILQVSGFSGPQEISKSLNILATIVNKC